MARVVVDVMPKPEILDPQGKAVTGALARLGFAGVTVRQGKRFELDVAGELTEERLAEVHRAAETLLANTVIETFNVRVEGAESAGAGAQVRPPAGAASDPPQGKDEALDPRTEQRGETVEDPHGQGAAGAASEPRNGTSKGSDAGVNQRDERVEDSRAQQQSGIAPNPPAESGDRAPSEAR